MKSITLIFLIFVSLCRAEGAAEFSDGGLGGDHLVTLIKNTDEFDEIVMKSNKIWIVDFFTSWCDGCKELVPVWKKTAKLLNGVIKVAALNVEGKEIVHRLNIENIPHIMIFGLDKEKPEVYKAVKEPERSSQLYQTQLSTQSD